MDFVPSLNSRRTIGPLTGEALKGQFQEIFLLSFLIKSNISLQAADSHSKRVHKRQRICLDTHCYILPRTPLSRDSAAPTVPLSQTHLSLCHRLVKFEFDYLNTLKSQMRKRFIVRNMGRWSDI